MRKEIYFCAEEKQSAYARKYERKRTNCKSFNYSELQNPQERRKIHPSLSSKVDGKGKVSF